MNHMCVTCLQGFFLAMKIPLPLIQHRTCISLPSHIFPLLASGGEDFIYTFFVWLNLISSYISWMFFGVSMVLFIKLSNLAEWLSTIPIKPMWGSWWDCACNEVYRIYLSLMKYIFCMKRTQCLSWTVYNDVCPYCDYKQKAVSGQLMIWYGENHLIALSNNCVN